MNKLKRSLALFIATSALLFAPIVAAAPAYALFEGAKEQACAGANLNDTGCSATPDTKVDETLKTVINILSFVVGIISVIMIIVGGIRFATSQGDGSSTSAARNTIIYALVGLAVVALAQFIVQFVLGKIA